MENCVIWVEVDCILDVILISVEERYPPFAYAVGAERVSAYVYIEVARRGNSNIHLIDH